MAERSGAISGSCLELCELSVKPSKQQGLAGPNDVPTDFGSHGFASLRSILVKQQTKERQLGTTHLCQVVILFSNLDTAVKEGDSLFRSAFLSSQMSPKLSSLAEDARKLRVLASIKKSRCCR
jgi:hypothetical protein